MSSMDPESDEYKANKEIYDNLKADTRIFKEAAKVYSKEYPIILMVLYLHQDHLTVGEEPGKEKRNQQMEDGIDVSSGNHLKKIQLIS